MRKINLLIISLLITQLDITAQKNVIKTDLFGDLFTSLIAKMPMPKISYERALNKFISAQVSFEYGIYEKGDSHTDLGYLESKDENKGYGIMPEIKFYPFNVNKSAPMGFFISVHYRYYDLNHK